MMPFMQVRRIIMAKFREQAHIRDPRTIDLLLARGQFCVAQLQQLESMDLARPLCRRDGARRIAKAVEAKISYH